MGYRPVLINHQGERNVDLMRELATQPEPPPPKPRKPTEPNKLLKKFAKHWSHYDLATEYRFSDNAKFYDPKSKVTKIRRWRMDVLILGTPICIELHGGTYTRGRHTRGSGFEGDRVKMNAALSLGFIPYELTSKMLTQAIIKPILTHALNQYDIGLHMDQLKRTDLFKTIIRFGNDPTDETKP